MDIGALLLQMCQIQVRERRAAYILDYEVFVASGSADGQIQMANPVASVHTLLQSAWVTSDMKIGILLVRKKSRREETKDSVISQGKKHVDAAVTQGERGVDQT